MSTWIRIAELVKAKHLKGGLVAHSVAGLPFLLDEGLSVAFVPPQIDAPRQGIVTDVHEEAKGFVVCFDSVTDAAAAEALAGCYCLARREDLPEDVVELTEGGIEGFSVIDSVAGAIGTAASINEMPGQNLLEVSRPDGRDPVLIPLVDEFIDGIDEDSRTIFVTVPAGLLDL